MAAIAGAFWPSRFETTSDTNSARLAEMIAGCTVAARAASKAAAPYLGWLSAAAAQAQQAATHDGGTGEPVRGQHAVYPPSRYITWPV